MTEERFDVPAMMLDFWRNEKFDFSQLPAGWIIIPLFEPDNEHWIARAPADELPFLLDGAVTAAPVLGPKDAWTWHQASRHILKFEPDIEIALIWLSDDLAYTNWFSELAFLIGSRSTIENFFGKSVDLMFAASCTVAIAGGTFKIGRHSFAPELFLECGQRADINWMAEWIHS